MKSVRTGATVVVSHRARQGCERTYAEWQARISTEAARFEGFEGSEVVPPREGVHDAWVVVYRFRTPAHLAEWLTSDVRRGLMAEAEALLDVVREDIVATPRGGSGLVTAVASANVVPGCEEKYLSWYEGITELARTFPGFVDSEVFRPVRGVQDEWIVVFRFASPETLDAWVHSEARRTWLSRAQPFVTRQDLQRVGSGLGGWFPRKAPGDLPPPAWKQAMAVLLGLYPVVMLLLIVWPTNSLSPAVDLFLRNVISVACLAWLVMPAVNHLLKRWLAPRSPRASALGTVAVLGAYSALLVLFSAVT